MNNVNHSTQAATCCCTTQSHWWFTYHLADCLTLPHTSRVEIKHRKSDLCLDVIDTNQDSGTNLQLYRCQRNIAQMFKVKPVTSPTPPAHPMPSYYEASSNVVSLGIETVDTPNNGVGCIDIKTSSTCRCLTVKQQHMTTGLQKLVQQDVCHGFTSLGLSHQFLGLYELGGFVSVIVRVRQGE